MQVLDVKTWPSIFYVGDMQAGAVVEFPPPAASGARLETTAAAEAAAAAAATGLCPRRCSLNGTCDQTAGTCICKEGFGGPACDVNVGWRCAMAGQGCVPGSTTDIGVYESKSDCEAQNDGCGFKYDCIVDQDTNDTSIQRVRAREASIIFGQNTHAEAVNRGCTQRYRCETSALDGVPKAQCVKVGPMDARGVSLDQCNAGCWFSSSPAVWPSFFANKDLNVAAARPESAAEQAFDSEHEDGSWNCTRDMGCVQVETGLGQFTSRDACERSTNGCGFTFTCAKGRVERVPIRSADTVALSRVEATASCLQQWKCEAYVPQGGSAASVLSMATATRCVPAEGWETDQALFPNESSCRAGCGFACGSGGGACTQQYGAQVTSRGACAQGCSRRTFVCNSSTGACEAFDLGECKQKCVGRDDKDVCAKQCGEQQVYANWGLCHLDPACAKDSCPPLGFAPPFPVACPPPRPVWACGKINTNTCELQFDTSPQLQSACSCADKPCQNGGVCTGPNTCTCAAGWTGAQCETAK